MLRTLLLMITAFFAAMLAVIAVVLAVVSYRLHRRNRVVPDVETAAPLSWLGSPSAAPRLHRRLRVAVAPVHVPAKSSALDADRRTELCRNLVAEAIEIDHQLVLAARLPAKRRRAALVVLERRVSEVERIALRLGRMRRDHVPLGGREDADALADIAAELDLLDEAHAELVDIERANGLLDPTPLLRDAAPGVTPSPAHTPAPTPTPSPAPALGTATAPPAEHVVPDASTPMPAAAPVPRHRSA